MNALKGLLKLNNPILVRGDALGEVYCVIIGRQEVSLYFPRLPELPSGSTSSELLPPLYYNKKHSLEEWGKLRCYSSKEYGPLSSCATVHQIFLECITENPDLASEEIYSCIDEWRDLLCKRICFEKKYSIGETRVEHTERENIELFITDPVFNRYDPRQISHLTVGLVNIENSLTKEQLNNIFKCIKCGKKLKLEYELLAQAYEERSRGNYRYALVQALSAVEMCIGNKITVICDEKGIDAKRLIGKKSLGDKFEIIKALGLDWPTPNPNEEITKHRNDLFHIRLLSPTIQQLNEVISKIEIYLQTYYPDYFE